jgi:nucleoside 2-deoxyribosyltransferase
MKPVRIYLAGPMDAETDEFMTRWRRQVWGAFEHEIDDGYVELLDPCRRPHSDDLTYDEIVTMDFTDIDNADLLLVDNRCKPRENTGTSIEMYRAKEQNTPVIGWYDDAHKPSHVRIFMDWVVTKQAKSLNEAIDHIKEFYLFNNFTACPYND